MSSNNSSGGCGTTIFCVFILICFLTMFSSCGSSSSSSSHSNGSSKSSYSSSYSSGSTDKNSTTCPFCGRTVSKWTITKQGMCDRCLKNYKDAKKYLDDAS
jgi:hypothetical protein